MHLSANLIGNHALALKQKTINPQGPCYVRLVGRKSGLIDWLLNICGIDTTSILEVYSNRIEYKYSSLSGTTQEVIPLSKISNLVCGYFTPVILIVVAVILFLAALFFGLKHVTSWILLAAAVIAFVYYFLKKSILISIIPNSGSSSCIAFKRSLIENENITKEEAEKIIGIIVALVEKANTNNKTENKSDFTSEKTSPENDVKNSKSHKKSPEAVVFEQPKVDTGVSAEKETLTKTQCPHCEQHYEIEAKYVDEIIKCQRCGQDFVIEPMA